MGFSEGGRVALSLLRGLHVLGGGVALALLLVPLLSRKGGRLHVRVGWVYVAAMTLAVVSASVLACARLLDPASPAEARPFFLFLLYIALLSGAFAWYGLRVLRAKHRRHPSRDPLDVGPSIVLVMASLATSTYGWFEGSALLSGFPMVGLYAGTRQLAYWLRSPQEKQHWWYEHMGGMFGAGIATLTAFVVFGGPRLLGLPTSSPVLWFAPTAILLPVLSLWTRRERARFARSAQDPRSRRG